MRDEAARATAPNRRHANPRPRLRWRKIRPDELSLREALDLVYRLKGLVAE